MIIYNAVRNPPKEALKPIKGGRLSGLTDINPMWRIKTLTEQFGACGVGWKYEIVDKRLEHGGNDEIAAFVDINLYIKDGDAWSEAIPGTGGSSFVAKESKGMYTSDECFKMALTDAISVACKMLGFGADVYWQKDRTKYTDTDKNQEDKPKFARTTTTGTVPPKGDKATIEEVGKIYELVKEKGIEINDFFVRLGDLKEEKKISSQYSHNKKTQEVYWTKKDIAIVKADIEGEELDPNNPDLPF